MENKGLKLLSISLIILFVGSIIFFIASLSLEYKKSPSQSKQVISDFLANTNMAAEYYIPGSQQFADIIRARISSNKTIAAVTITQGDKTLFAYPVSSPYIKNGNNNEPTITSASSFITIESNSMILAGLPSNIKIAIYKISPTTLYSFIRIVFLIILAGTLIAGIGLLYIYLSETSEQNDIQNEISTSNDSDDIYDINDIQNFDAIEKEEKTNENDYIQQEEIEPKEEIESNHDIENYETENEDNYNEIENHELQDTDNNLLLDKDTEELDSSTSDLDIEKSVEKDFDETVSTEEKNLDKTENEKETTNPIGLFSPTTGFGWESYLETRLDSELIRSASSEEDISLIIIRIQDLDRTSDMAHKIYEQLLDFFKFKDLIFEYGRDAFSCLMNNTNINTAISFAEQVYTAITTTISNAEQKNEVGIGLSSRSFRLIPGKRLLTEAKQALEKAFSDNETAIVAFQVDPDKYRQYISEQLPSN